MGEERKNLSGQDKPKDIVKDIFDKPKPSAKKVSPLFTHFKRSPKVVSARKVSLPAHMKPLAAAIDIGSASIKLLQLAEAEKKKLCIATVDREAYRDLNASLRKIIARNRVKGPCLVTLPPKDVKFYNMIFPPMTAEELLAAVRYKLAQLKPFDLDAEKINFKIMKWDAGAAPKTSQARVVVAAVPKDIIADKISFFKKQGLNLAAIEPSQAALTALSRFYKTEGHKDEASLWLEIGEKAAFLAIERAGVLCFSRALNTTGSLLTRAIAQHYKMGGDEAEALKKQYGLSFWAPDKQLPSVLDGRAEPDVEKDKSKLVYYGLVSLMENLVVDIEQTFKYFSYQVAQSQITKFDRVILSGGGTGLNNLDKFLSVRLGVPVERVNAFSKLPLSPIVQTQRKELLGAPAAFGVAAGLAVSQQLADARRINFITHQERKYSVISEILSEPMARVIIIAVIALSIFTSREAARAGSYKARMKSLTKEFMQTKKELIGLQSEQLDLSKIEAELANKNDVLSARLKLLQASYRQTKDFSRVLNAVARLMPEDVWATKLKYEEGRLVISASTSDVNRIAGLIEEIKASRDFEGAEFSYTQKEAMSDVYNFEIIANMKGYRGSKEMKRETERLKKTGGTSGRRLKG